MPSRLQQDLKQNRPFRSVGHEAVVALLRTADVVRRYAGDTIHPFGITLPQYNVLRILRGSHPTGMCINDVADRLIERNPGITRMIDRLEGYGWVRRERQVDDRRMIMCYLTATGLKLVNKLDGPVSQANDEVVAGLSTTDTRKLVKLLERIREQIS